MTDMSPAASQLLATYFGTMVGRRAGMPDELERWVRREDRLSYELDDAPPPRKPLVLVRDGRRLTIRLLTGRTQRLLLLEERRISVPAKPLETLGLTGRETEVLSWVAQGKTNDEIATILSLSPRTVEKHLENIYPKLGVENRTAAAARALAVLNGAPQTADGRN